MKSTLTKVLNSGIGQKTTRLVGKTTLALKDKSPQILTVGGTVALGLTIYTAIKSTMELDPVLNETEKQLSEIDEQFLNHDTGEELPGKGKEKAKVYAKTSVELAKLYWPTVLGAATTVACFGGSNYILNKRNIGLLAAYKGVTETYNEYRKRVIEEFGEEADKKIRFGSNKDTEEVLDITKDGEEKKVDKDIYKFDEDNRPLSPYAKLFDAASRYWEKDCDKNLWFLKIKQEEANGKLRRYGYLTLNDVYKMLDLPLSDAGFQVGWRYNSEFGDGFVDFGIFGTEKARKYVNGREAAMWLDFNVDDEPLIGHNKLSKF